MECGLSLWDTDSPSSQGCFPKVDPHTTQISPFFDCCTRCDNILIRNLTQHADVGYDGMYWFLKTPEAPQTRQTGPLKYYRN